MGWLPGSGCVLWLQMDERQGSIAYDLSGNNNHGTIYGPTWKRGKIGYCLSFDGVDDDVNCGNDPSLAITGDLTIEAWIKQDVLQLKCIVGKHYCYEYEFWVDSDGELRLYHGDGAWERIISSGARLGDYLGKWVHILVVRTKTPKEIFFYVNGNLISMHSYTRDVVAQAWRYLWIAARTGAEYFFSGLIDEVRVYNRALSVEEIKAHYWYGLTRALRPP